MILDTLPVAQALAAPSLHDTAAHDGPPFLFVLIPLFWLLVIGAVAIVVALTRRRRDHVQGARAGERALAERYAAGEIDEDEYRARRAVLRESTRPR